MAIKISCSCGGRFKAKDEHAGRKVKCPQCQQMLVVPQPVTRPVVSQPAPQQVSQPVAAIEVACPCGGRFKARAEHAGRKVKCPRCAQILLVPTPATGAASPKTSPVADTATFTNFFDEAFNESAATSAASQEEQENPSYEIDSPFSSHGMYGHNSDTEETSRGIRVAIEVDCSIRQEMAARKVVRDAFMQHLVVGKEHYQNGSVVVTITHWEVYNHELDATMSCSGTLNGHRIHCHAKYSKVHKSPWYGENHLEEMLGNFMGKLGTLLFYRKRLPGKIRNSAENCIDLLCVEMDRAIGLKSRALSVVWFGMVQKTLLLLSILFGPAFGYFGMHPFDGKESEPMFIFLASSAAAGIFFFFVSRTLLVLCMPNRFFKRDPRGRRYLRRFFARGATQFRVHVILLSAILSFIVYQMCVFAHATIQGKV